MTQCQLLSTVSPEFHYFCRNETRTYYRSWWLKSPTLRVNLVVLAEPTKVYSKLGKMAGCPSLCAQQR
jgi:hypothetical protein